MLATILTKLIRQLCSSLQINLSHNRIPFVTKLMFPEHKWIPYRLEKLDLSHNNMPVITNDMLVGTKHLKYLNISYNILSDVRKGKTILVKKYPFLLNSYFFQTF